VKISVAAANTRVSGKRGDPAALWIDRRRIAELPGLLLAAGVAAFRRNPENFRVNSGEYERAKSERAEINVVSCRDSESANSRCVRPGSLD